MGQALLVHADEGSKVVSSDLSDYRTSAPHRSGAKFEALKGESDSFDEDENEARGTGTLDDKPLLSSLLGESEFPQAIRKPTVLTDPGLPGPDGSVRRFKVKYARAIYGN